MGGQTPQGAGSGGGGYGVVLRPEGPGNVHRARMVGALGLVLAAVATTAFSASWIWNKADAVTPVDLPAADGTVPSTITPSVRPSPTPPPVGKVLGAKMYAANQDAMPLMSSAWEANGDNTGLYGGTGIWLPLHEKYDGKDTWGNYVSFGALNKKIPYKNTPAGLREATVRTATTAVVRLYTDQVKLIGKATHRPITVDGHRGHELTIKVDVRKPKLPETFSTLMVAVIDRGDGTAVVSVADIAGSTPQWLPVWRTKVSQIEFSN